MMDAEEFTALREAAMAMHEMYRELRSAGFTQSEAIEMIVKLFRTIPEEGEPDA